MFHHTLYLVPMWTPWCLLVYHPPELSLTKDIYIYISTRNPSYCRWMMSYVLGSDREKRGFHHEKPRTTIQNHSLMAFRWAFV